MTWRKLSEVPDQRVLGHRSSIVYWEIKDGSVFHQGRKLRTANADEFEVRLDECHEFLGRDSTQVFHAWTRLKTVDARSFEVIDDFYCADANLAYCEFETSLKPLKGKDRKHFTALTKGYARDSLHGYYCGTAIRGCTSPLTLRVPETAAGAPYALDDEKVFYETACLKGAEPETWVWLGGAFSKDAKQAFFAAKKLPRVDLESWELLPRKDGLHGAYSRDARSVFCMHFRLPKANPVTWRLLSPDYSTDGRRVFFQNKHLEDADVDTFKVISKPRDLQSRAQDKRGEFKASHRV